MLPQPVLIVIVQYVVQALLALVIMLILRKFFRQYKNDFFHYWSWSWLALFVNMVGSCVALANAFMLPLDHPFRLIISIITVVASFLQIAWLYAGTREISRTRKINQKQLRLLTILIIPISILLVMMHFQNPNGGDYRIFYRVGIKSLLAGIVFGVCASMLWKISKTGIGIRFIIFSFLLYGLLQFNYFLVTFFEITNVPYGVELPYFMGTLDLFLQSLMGLGMIISVLEIEQDNLKKANNELDTFLYRSSHDLRAPLTTISGIVSAIKLTDDIHTKEEFLNAIQGRLDQADNVIRDIITLRKGQKTDLSIVELDLKEEISREFDALVDPNGTHPKVEISGAENARIKTDPARLHTILTNILSNSIKYHNYEQENPKVSVLLKPSESGYHITIEDNGAGIDEKHLPKIFDMFYRANTSSNGTGLGLYLVKDALEHLGGSIQVSSEKGRGTTFGIHLPDHS